MEETPMKKILMLLLAMSLFSFMTIAADGLGLTVGVGYVEPDTDWDDDEYIKAEITYEAEFGDIEVFGELIYNHPTDSDADGWMTIEGEGRYNFNGNMQGILNLFVEMPFDDDDDVEMWLTPGFQYMHTFGFGNFYARADIPLYLTGELDAMDFVGLDFTFSLMRLRDKRDMPNTWGVELGLENWLTEPTEDIFLNYLTITPYYEHEWFYAELEVLMPLYEDGMDYEGMTITPEFDINIKPVDGLSLWINVPIQNIGADEGDAIIGFGVGVRYSF